MCFQKSLLQDSNLRPTLYESVALPTELRRLAASHKSVLGTYPLLFYILVGEVLLYGIQKNT